MLRLPAAKKSLRFRHHHRRHAKSRSICARWTSLSIGGSLLRGPGLSWRVLRRVSEEGAGSIGVICLAKDDHRGACMGGRFPPAGAFVKAAVGQSSPKMIIG
jgi:hypothetical protein